jgi:hypothetical protein
MPLLEEVFKLNGVPTYTFVRPTEFNRLFVALRTPGRGIVLEGPSGIGKTTAVTKALQELLAANVPAQIVELSPRRPQDVEYIDAIQTIGYEGIVVIDDFHRLTDKQQLGIADYLKVLADTEETKIKLVIVGINNAGAKLVDIAPDLHARVELIRLEANSDEKVFELVTAGEEALNIKISDREKLIENAQGSFYLAQMLCSESCLQGEVLQTTEVLKDINVSVELIKTKIFERLQKRFDEATKTFVRGMKFQREGRAPYYQILKWLAESSEWSISLDQEIREHPNLRGSVSQVIDKGFLADFMNRNLADFEKLLHFDAKSKTLTVEDPQFLFYLRETIWPDLAVEAGFTNPERPHLYDFALSFAGANRHIAEGFAARLREMQFEVFYDKFEESRIIAEDVEEYLRPIYQTQSRYVIVILSNEYPCRIWTKFESDAFRIRFGEGAVVPIILSDVVIDSFSELTRRGHIRFDLSSPLDEEVVRIVEVLREKISG